MKVNKDLLEYPDYCLELYLQLITPDPGVAEAMAMFDKPADKIKALLILTGLCDNNDCPHYCMPDNPEMRLIWEKEVKYKQFTKTDWYDICPEIQRVISLVKTVYGITPKLFGKQEENDK